MKTKITKSSYLIFFLTIFTNSIAQLHTLVFIPATNGYNCAKQGVALLNNGDTIQGKFLYYKARFTNNVQIRLFAADNKRKFIKYEPIDFKQVSIIGHCTKNIYVFISVKGALIYVNDTNDSLQLNHKSLRKLK